MESGPAFAEKEIRVLLAGLGGENHNSRLKAIRRFQEYISDYRPDANDEDVEYLFQGGEETAAKGTVFFIMRALTVRSTKVNSRGLLDRLLS